MPLVRMNFGSQQHYEIECFGLMDSGEEQLPGAGEQPGQQQPGQQQQKPMNMSIVLPNQPLGRAGAMNTYGKNLIFYNSLGRTAER